MGSLYQTTPEREPESNSRPLIIAAVVLVLVVGLIFFLVRTSKPAPPPPSQMSEAPYASNLQISDLHLSTAKNFINAEVTYLEGNIANTGAASLTGAQVLCIFRNSMGEVVDTPVVPLQIEAVVLGQNDFVPLSTSPLMPNQKRPFRLTFEHVSADWNMGMPELRVVGATTK